MRRDPNQFDRATLAMHDLLSRSKPEDGPMLRDILRYYLKGIESESSLSVRIDELNVEINGIYKALCEGRFQVLGASSIKEA